MNLKIFLKIKKIYVGFGFGAIKAGAAVDAGTEPAVDRSGRGASCKGVIATEVMCEIVIEGAIATLRS